MRLAFSAIVATLACSASSAQQLPSSSTVTDFVVTDTAGNPAHYATLKGRVTVIMFFSTRCPISNAFNYRRNQLHLEFRDRVRFVAIDSNANESLTEERDYARSVGFDFPVYRDAGNVVADRLGAQVTTDTFVIDSAGAIRYHGFIEDSPNPTRAKTRGLRLAIEAVLDSREVPASETRAAGCSIRRAGIETR